MTGFIDLHLHSNYSDGVYPPAEVVRRVKEAGLVAMALCDHDNIDGTDEAMDAGGQLGIEVLAGVELSTLWGKYEDIHLLGYGFDPHHPELRQSLAEFREFREGRNEQILGRVNEKLLAECRFPIDFDNVRQKAGGTLGRPHIAMALREAGYVRNVEEAFARYLIPCNVAKRFFPLEEAIALVHRAGGVAVLAHPPFITSDFKTFEALLDDFVSLGLDGVEAWNSGATNHQIDQYITAARRRGLIVTGGSDFHGIERGEIVIGGGRGNLKVPYACIDEIRGRLPGRR